MNFYIFPHISDGDDFRKRYATLDDRRESLRAKPNWFSDLTTPYEGFAEGPPRALGNVLGRIDGIRAPMHVDA